MASTLDRVLRRLRPTKKKTERRLKVERQEAASRAAEVVIDAFPADGAPIRPITRPEFEEMIEVYPYYKGRWGYTSVALAQAADLITRHGLKNALEMGTPVRPVIVGADVIDIHKKPQLRPDVQVTIHDATVAPWPAADKQYDLFVALQVFEHLQDKQAQAFMEVRRIARHAIISLPIDWDMADPTNCHYRIPHERVLSWFAPVVPTRVVEGSLVKRKRLVYVFEDLPAPE